MEMRKGCKLGLLQFLEEGLGIRIWGVGFGI